MISLQEFVQILCNISSFLHIWNIFAEIIVCGIYVFSWDLQYSQKNAHEKGGQTLR
jgi:hypothetical protein